MRMKPPPQLALPIAAVRYFHRIGGLYYEMGDDEYDAQVRRRRAKASPATPRGVST